MKKKALQMTEVWHSYGNTTAVKNLSIVLHEGEVVCLLGPSGCGKSTALRIAAGLERVQRGVVELGDVTVSDREFHLPAEDRNVGLVFQDYALFPHLSVVDNVKFGLKRDRSGIAESKAVRALKMVNMEKFLTKYPHMLSGGEQQRVALARALAPQPEVMLLDEPYSGLDARLREKIRDEVLHLLREQGCATLMVTHDAEEAMFMADKIVVMNDGHVLQVGSPDELYFQPVNSFVAGVFGELNKLNGFVRENKAITPLADFPVDEFESGTEVEVILRPEGLCLSPLEGSDIYLEASVVESRLLGRMSYIHLSSKCSNRDGENIYLHSKMPGRVLPSSGEKVRVYVDLKQTFVFAKKSKSLLL